MSAGPTPCGGQIELVPYDPAWPRDFAALRHHLGGVLGDVARAVEHVGSTVVPGLAAKPILDVDVVLPEPGGLEEAIARLAAAGYRHEGDLGIAGREAFAQPPAGVAHHLYVLAPDAAELARHLAFRDHLRASPAARRAYGCLKRRLARAPGGDRARYGEGTSAFVADIVERAAKAAGAAAPAVDDA